MPRIYANAPKGHPIYEFLQKLPSDAACDPCPDFFEGGTRTRYFVGFTSVNCSARMAKFLQLLKASGIAAQEVGRSYRPTSNCCNLILYLFGTKELDEGGHIISSPVFKPSNLQKQPDPRDEEPEAAPTPPTALPDTMHVPSY